MRRTLLLALWSILALFLFINFTVSFEENYGAFADDPSVLHTYNRFAEIEKQCKPFLSSASDLKPDDTRNYRLNELHFSNGDWEQENGRSLLMPFDDCDLPGNNSSLDNPLKLVNFDLVHVNAVQRWKNKISLIGVLSIGITRNRAFGFDWRLKFNMMPGTSVLSILFEGVYIQSNENGGERLLCMLGNSTLPYNKWTNDPLNLAKGYWSSNDHKPPLLQDDQILLVLRFPQTFNLTRRAILGEMRSLNGQSSLRYFDKVHITSQLGGYSKYQFSSELLKSITCNPHAYQEELIEDGAINMISILEFCNNLRSISHEYFRVVPNWKFNSIYLYPGKLGPFHPGKEIKAADWSYSSVRLVMEHINCQQGTYKDGLGIAMVSAVLRAIPAPTGNHGSTRRTGLSGMTLSTEGIWNPSSGQLCMVGCLGVVDSRLQRCDSQISLYFPQAYSIKQRSMIYGSIFSINDEKDSFLPLIFDAVMRPGLLKEYYIQYVASYLSYNYSKIDLARALRNSKQPSKFHTIVKQSLLKYPGVEDREELFDSLYFLSKDFEIDTFALPDSISAIQISKIFILMDVLSLGPLFVRYAPWLKKSNPPLGAQDSLRKSQLLNVSMHLSFTKARFSPTTSFNNLSELYLEGLYDPLVGQMYIIDCRKAIVKGISLERGLDCLIEVNVEYPSITTAWLINPKAKFTITSQRKEDDPLHFSSISLKTLPLRYEKHYKVTFRKTFEDILRNLMLCMSIAIILGQFLHMKAKGNVIPYISLVMLGLQILGYGLPLISGAEILFRWKESDYFKAHQYGLDQLHPSVKVLNYLAKFLLLVVFLLTVKLFQKVSASRKRPAAWGKTMKRVPSDKLVLLVTLIFHNFGFLLLLVIDGIMISPEKDGGTIGYIPMLGIWMIKLEEYIGLVQDFFLLPQIIGNFWWHNHAKSLCRLYYIGLTLVRVLVRLYDCIRDPVIARL